MLGFYMFFEIQSVMIESEYRRSRMNALFMKFEKKKVLPNVPTRPVYLTKQQPRSGNLFLSLCCNSPKCIEF